MDNKDTFIRLGKAVVEAEATALGQFANTLDESFAEAIDLLLNATGRVIVCGMGKSGHVARKIAATFASTGTPAHFVHPAEASHGDLGMLARGDVALVLSNSGETPELADVIAYTRRFDIPLIGVASKPNSTLIKQSDIGILLPQTGEACGTGIVPSSSTTMTLALGDAMAITLMQHRQFSPANFREFHPGGKLGAQLSKVGDLMHAGDSVPLVGHQDAMPSALLEMTQRGFGVVGVTDDNGRLIGIVTDGDLRRHMKGLLEKSVSDVMTRNPRTISFDVLAEEAVAKMTLTGQQITSLFVVDQNGMPEGLIHIHDCLRAGIV